MDLLLWLLQPPDVAVREAKGGLLVYWYHRRVICRLRIQQDSEAALLRLVPASKTATAQGTFQKGMVTLRAPTTLLGPASQPWLQLSPATLGNESTAVDGNGVKYQPPAHPPPTLQGLGILTAED